MQKDEGGGSSEGSPFARKVRRRFRLSPSDLEALGFLSRDLHRLPRGTVLADRGLGPHPFLLHDGWAMRFGVLADGRRQILGFALPGDIVGVGAAVLGQATEAVSAITPVTVSRFSLDTLEATLRDSPALRQAILWSLAQDYSLLCDRLVGLGRRSAIERIARTLIEVTARLKAVQADVRALPLSQPMLGDAAGLSAVHVNRTLKRLRSLRLVSRDSPRGLMIENASGLTKIAQVEQGDPLHALIEGLDVGDGNAAAPR